MNPHDPDSFREAWDKLYKESAVDPAVPGSDHTGFTIIEPPVAGGKPKIRTIRARVKQAAREEKGSD